MGLVPRIDGRRFLVLALVIRVEMANSASVDRIQRSDDYLSAGDVITDSLSYRDDVLLGLGRTGINRADLSRRMVRKHGGRPLSQRPDILRNKVRRGHRNRRAAVLHRLFLLRIRSAQPA